MLTYGRNNFSRNNSSKGLTVSSLCRFVAAMFTKAVNSCSRNNVLKNYRFVSIFLMLLTTKLCLKVNLVMFTKERYHDLTKSLFLLLSRP